MRRLMLTFTVAIFLVTEVASAYMWGSGVNMGNPMCPQPYAAARGSVNDFDTVRAAQNALNSKKRARDRARRDMENAKKDFEDYKKAIKDHFSNSAAQDVLQHMDQSSNRTNWPQCNGQGVLGISAGTDRDVAQHGELSRKFASNNLWCSRESDIFATYAEDGGSFNSDLCKVKFQPILKKKDSGGTEYACKRALEKYSDAKSKNDEAAEAFARAEDEFKQASNALRRAQDDAQDALDSDTEGGICESGNCPRSNRTAGRQPSDLQVAGSLFLAGLGGAAAYSLGRHAIDTNGQLGWQSSPYQAASVGYPMLMHGIYGALGGGIGPGAMACAGTVGGAFPYGPMGAMNGMPFGGPLGGAFGYPPNMMGPFPGGGMYMPGMSPGGFNPLGMMNPAMMNPAMLPMMNNPFMNPMSQMMNPFGSPFGNQFGNPMMNPNMMAMQYQQQMMQQYMGQMQQYMQQQQFAMQDYMYRQQTVSGLQQEMARIQMQIYSISSGMGGMGAPAMLPYPGPGGYGGYGGTPGMPGMPGYPGYQQPRPYYPGTGYPGTPPYVPGSNYPGTGYPYTSPYVPRASR